jgi:alpha-tubulin suppressor-like RCC1 family protein
MAYSGGIMMKTRMLWRLQGLLAAVLLVSLSGCHSDDTVPDEQPPERTAPIIIESSQSATRVRSQSPVTLSVTAQDEGTPTLGFSWRASAGTLGAASNTDTTSTVIWNSPSCVPANTARAITVTVMVSNGVGASVSKTFTVPTNPCPFVSAGDSHTVALRGDGTVWAWGANGSGQLGDGTTTLRDTPVQVPGLTDIIAVATGDSHVLALRNDGTVWAWGSNDSYQLGDGTTTARATPAQVPRLTGVTAVDAAGSHSVALREDGTVWEWGTILVGPPQRPGGPWEVSQHTMPVQVPELTGITAVAAGADHVLALRGDGTAWAWGGNLGGQLGQPSVYKQLTPVQVPGLTGITSVAASGEQSLALLGDGTVWAWGRNAFFSARTEPRQLPGLAGITTLGVGDYHALALRDDGTVWAWGSNSGGQLGDGTTAEHTGLVQVSGLSAVTALAAGGGYSVAMSSDGTVWSWGRNYSGQLGIGVSPRNVIPLPIQATGLTGITALAAGLLHSMALRNDGTVWTWGGNWSGQLGNGMTTPPQATPGQVPGLTDITAVVAGEYHALALRGDGTVWAWGDNYFGSLGTGLDPDRQTTPVQASRITGVTTVVAGYTHSLALRGDGTVWAWGENNHGQLGETNPWRDTLMQVPGLMGFTAVAVGGAHSLALRGDGTVWAWGDNGYGQLGDGTTTQRNSPVQVSGLTGVTALAAGGDHSVALRGDGTVWAWGDNGYGQLGDGTATPRATPVQVPGLTDIIAVATGAYHVLALRNDGTVWAWGANDRGQLGMGTTAPQAAPVQVSGLTGVTALAAGTYHAVALRDDGTVWGWGDNGNAQLGDGRPLFMPTPVKALLP